MITPLRKCYFHADMQKSLYFSHASIIYCLVRY